MIFIYGETMMATQTQATYIPGDIDLTFGLQGKAPLHFPDGKFSNVASMRVTHEGKILVAGSKDNEYMIGCLSEDGVIDTSFGRMGSIVGKFKGRDSRAGAIHILDDGRLLITGSYYFNPYYLPAACRLLPSGELAALSAMAGSSYFPSMSCRRPKKV
jgi:hypothetical protein